MMLRPQIRKKKNGKASKTHNNTFRLFAFCFLMLPLALGITAWVLRENLWLQFVMEEQMTQTYQPQLARSLGDTPLARSQAKDLMERLVGALKVGDVTIDKLLPLRQVWQEAMVGGLSEEEAREIMARVTELLDS